MFVQSVVVLLVLCLGTMTTTFSLTNIGPIKNVPADPKFDMRKLSSEDQALIQHFDRVAAITQRLLPSMETKMRFLRRLMQNEKYRNLYKQQMYAIREKQLNAQRLVKPRLG